PAGAVEHDGNLTADAKGPDRQDAQGKQRCGPGVSSISASLQHFGPGLARRSPSGDDDPFAANRFAVCPRRLWGSRRNYGLRARQRDGAKRRNKGSETFTGHNRAHHKSLSPICVTLALLPELRVLRMPVSAKDVGLFG